MLRSRIALSLLLPLFSLAFIAASAHAACSPGFVKFAAGVSLPTGISPAGCAAGDFDGDGRTDLVVVNDEYLDSTRVTGTFSFLHGNGDGTFASPVATLVGDMPFGLAAGDFDGDGRLDVAIARTATHFVSVFRGDGAGGFTLLAALDMGPAPHHVTAADLNHDGILDLVAANNTVFRLTVRLGTGGGGFGPPTSYPLANYGTDVTAGDLNGDGHPDLVAAQYTTGSVAVLIGNGDGTFRPRTNVNIGNIPYCVTLADVNSDGRLDLFVGSQGNYNCMRLLGNGDGTFGTPLVIGTYAVGQVLVEDLDGNGTNDLLFSEPTQDVVVERRGDAGGNMSSPESRSTGYFPIKMASGDFNGDGLRDVAVMNFYSTTATVLLGHCDEAPAGFDHIVVTDVPNDQGGHVTVSWAAQLYDSPGGATLSYGVFERAPGGPWIRVATTLATHDPTHLYSYVATTAQDSTPAGNPYTSFFVRALTTNANVYFDSPVDSGYSVDNLAPPAPANLTAFAGGGVTVVDWTPSAAPDVAYYNVYAYLPPPATQLDAVPVASVPAPPYTYPLDAPRLFQVAAVDIHGNMGPMSSTVTQYPTPVDASLASWRVTPNGVELEWLVDARGVTSATLERGDGAGTWTIVASGTPDPNGRLVLADDAVAPGTTALYRLAFTTSEGTFHSAPSTILVPALALSLEGARPNPAASATLSLAFTLRTGASASLELYDVAGRRVLAREVGAFGPGRHVLDLRDAHLAGGVYLARLTQGGEQRQARIVVL